MVTKSIGIEVILPVFLMLHTLRFCGKFKFSKIILCSIWLQSPPGPSIWLPYAQKQLCTCVGPSTVPKTKVKSLDFFISFLKSPWSMGYFTSQAASSRQLEQFSASISCVGGTLSDPYNIKFPLTFMLWLCSEKWMSCGCQLLFYTITLNINVSGNSMVYGSLK